MLSQWSTQLTGMMRSTCIRQDGRCSSCLSWRAQALALKSSTIPGGIVIAAVAPMQGPASDADRKHSTQRDAAASLQSQSRCADMQHRTQWAGRNGTAFRHTVRQPHYSSSLDGVAVHKLSILDSFSLAAPKLDLNLALPALQKLRLIGRNISNATHCCNCQPGGSNRDLAGQYHIVQCSTHMKRRPLTMISVLPNTGPTSGSRPVQA